MDNLHSKNRKFTFVRSLISLYILSFFKFQVNYFPTRTYAFSISIKNLSSHDMVVLKLNRSVLASSGILVWKSYKILSNFFLSQACIYFFFKIEFNYIIKCSIRRNITTPNMFNLSSFLVYSYGHNILFWSSLLVLGRLTKINFQFIYFFNLYIK